MMNRTGRTPALLAGLCLIAAGCGERTIATPSGLRYTDLTPGKGDEAKPGDYVEVHSVGRLQSDDTQFENTYDSRKPVLFRIGSGEVIRGWDEGVVGMKPGGKRKLYVPAMLGYGDRNMGVLLPPNSDLVFDIELVRIVPGFKAEDLKEGTGQEARWMDLVEVNYTGWLKDGGKKFDSNLDRGDPFVFQIGGRDPRLGGGVIRGWEGGVVGMKVGGKRKLTIPAELAYGKDGRPPSIPPDADLVFDVELLKINR
jgi:peptidylprolyl isomerase